MLAAICFLKVQSYTQQTPVVPIARWQPRFVCATDPSPCLLDTCQPSHQPLSFSLTHNHHNLQRFLSRSRMAKHHIQANALFWAES